MERKLRRIPDGTMSWAEVVRECHFVDNTAYIRELVKISRGGGKWANDSDNSYCGGGAGTSANGTYGGDGYACSITGAEVYYAGGGGGKNNRNGKGGGYACYGGGGSGGEGWISVKRGGSGVVIIRYARPSTGLAVLFR